MIIISEQTNYLDKKKKKTLQTIQGVGDMLVSKVPSQQA